MVLRARRRIFRLQINLTWGPKLFVRKIIGPIRHQPYGKTYVGLVLLATTRTSLPSILSFPTPPSPYPRCKTSCRIPHPVPQDMHMADDAAAAGGVPVQWAYVDDGVVGFVGVRGADLMHLL
jgi:hypothetical protein